MVRPIFWAHQIHFYLSLMKKYLKAIVDVVLLIAGLGTVIFSIYRLANGMEDSSVDRIDGQEIVVLAENTPVPTHSTVASVRNFSDQESKLSKELVNEPSPRTKITQTPTISTQVESIENGKEPLDTFLSQTEKIKSVDPALMLSIPDRIVVPAIQLDATVITAGSKKVKVGDQTFDQWVAPNQFATGWHENSASLDENSNTVINGHHNEYGKVFGRLIDLQPGETIYVYSGGKVYPFIISNKMILKEKGTDLKTRMENSAWIQPTTDKRLTLITCWPSETNTHRLIIVAIPYYFSPERVFG